MIVDPIDSQDVVSRWLQAAENDGESMAILLGCGSVSTHSIDWRLYSHLHYDGIGAFARALANAHSVPIPMPIGSFPPAGSTARSLPALAPNLRFPNPHPDQNPVHALCLSSSKRVC